MSYIYNKISDYIIVINYSGEVIFCNESFLKRLSYKGKDILNLKIDKIIKDKNNTFSNILKESIETNKTLEFYSKLNEIVKIDANISMENFNNEKSIFIIGKEVQSKPYTMEMLEDLLDNINISTFILDNSGKYLYVNKNFTKMLNKKREEIIGTYNSVHWSSEIYNEFDKNNKEVFENKNPKIFNEKVESNNNIYWYESYKAPIFDENNNFKYMVATTKNINLARILTEELYKKYNITSESSCSINENKKVDLNETLSNIGENVLNYTEADGMSILLYDRKKQGLIPTIKLKASNEYLKNVEFIPLKKDEVDSDKYRDLFNYTMPGNQISKVSKVNYNYNNEISYSSVYQIRLGKEFIGVIGLSYMKDNHPKFNSDEYMRHISNKIAMIIKNIRLLEEVNIANKKRKYTEKELEQYLNVSVDLVSIVGKDGYFKRVSHNWHNVLGWSEKELLSIPCREIIHPEEIESFKHKKKLDDIAGQITRNTIRFKHKKGHYIYLEWSSEYLPNEQVYVTSARDITKRLEMEKEKRRLEEAVEMEIVKNEFFANMSHEFRTPINIILGTMQVINKNIDKNSIKTDSLKKYTNYIKQNSYRLLRLVNNLIDISKMDIGAYELRCSNYNIINIIEDITLSVAGYTQNNKINLIFDTDNEEVITYCDPDKIERIMLNILSNAIKFTPENGFIEVNINSNSNEIIVSIKDSGVGIPPDKLDIIFDRFGQVDGSFNRKCEGSGIGLSLVKNLVEMHGGQIEVNSKVGEGSEFIFTIPIKLVEEINDENQYDMDRKHKHVERCDIEFSDIYSV